MIRLKDILNEDFEKAKASIQKIKDTTELSKLMDFIKDYKVKINKEIGEKVKMTKIKRGDSTVFRYEFNGNTYEALLDSKRASSGRYNVYKMEKGGGASGLKRGKLVAREFLGSPYELRTAIGAGRVK